MFMNLSQIKQRPNYYALLIFTPILILTGLSGFFFSNGLMSNAVPYCIFHLVSGIIGLICVWTQKEKLLQSFSIIFGILDLYQALASFMHWFPEAQFQWRLTDDILHIVIGIALIIFGLFGSSRK